MIQRILAIPCKRCVHEQIHYLTRAEVDAMLKAPDRTTWSGRRDQAWLLLAVQTGLRLSELTGLTRADVQFGVGAHVHVIGKGRKERCYTDDETNGSGNAGVAEGNDAWRRTDRIP